MTWPSEYFEPACDLGWREANMAGLLNDHR